MAADPELEDDEAPELDEPEPEPEPDEDDDEDDEPDDDPASDPFDPCDRESVR